MARHRRLFLFLLPLIALSLAACSASIDQRILFLTGGAWETDATVVFPAEIAPMLGNQIDGELAAIEQQIAGSGGSMQWERTTGDNGDLTYTVEAEGIGYDILRQVSFSDMNVTAQEGDGEERQLTFTATRPMDAASFTLTVVGGEILSSNGQVTGGDTVTWANSAMVMEAVLTERGGMAAGSLVPILAGIGLICLAGLVVFLVLRRRAPPQPLRLDPLIAPATPASPPAAGRFCVNCGTALRPNAKFCANCGHKQPDPEG